MLCYLAKFLYKIETVGIVTDIPQYMVGTVRGIKTKVIDKCNNFFMRRFDKYVFLTEAMNEFLNKKNKPYCVMEGICDENESQRVNELENKYSKKVCMYAGSLHKEYGIALLIDAFLKANPEESELHIYGNGNYVDKVKEFADSHDNIVYAGVVTGDVVVERECKATLLVNPRTTEGAYTKYSFPSKTLEYLASGTPVLMTKLPGMPEEYCDYVFLFEEESVDGYADKLKEILAKSKEELHRDGLKGKQFVLEKKNNIYQAMKVFKQLNL